jgi:hypothetical protein
MAGKGEEALLVKKGKRRTVAQWFAFLRGY